MNTVSHARNRIPRFLIVPAILLASACRAAPPERVVELHALPDSDGVHLTLSVPEAHEMTHVLLYRSFVDLDRMNAFDLRAYPITKTLLTGRGASTRHDTLVAHNCTYYYYAKAVYRDGRVAPSRVVSATMPDVAVNTLSGRIRALVVDKVNYFVELRTDDGRKRYPINLGGDPHTRKLHFDRLSTPEGRYRVAYLNPRSSFHKAIGVSYPNVSDHARYDTALRKGTIPVVHGQPRSIGGGIQLHGGGIGNNWTWGCIAMRNDDLDQLFALTGMRPGLPIVIVGKSFTRDSMPDVL